MVQVISPEMPIRLVNEAFHAVQDNVKDNSDLVNLDMVTQYSSAVGNQNTYGQVPVHHQRPAAAGAAAAWFAALAHDIAATGTQFGSPTTTATTGTGPSAPGSDPATASTTATAAAPTS